MDANNTLTLKNESASNFSTTPFIVAIGASAGGLQALGDYFEHAEPSDYIAYVVVQHLPPDYKSMLPELLSRHTKILVQTAEDGMLVKANHIYLMPNQYDMTIKYGKLRLTEKSTERRLNLPIDRFFQSLAIDRKVKAVGIILSGTGSDGTLGMTAIQEHGGLLIVQSPESAEFTGMPTSVIEAGLTDYILTPQNMYKELLESIIHPDIVRTEQEVLLKGQTETVLKILALIKSTNGMDFTYYKHPTIHRTIVKRMGMLGIDVVEDYLNYLIKNDDEAVVLAQQFLIGTTHFFRDESAFALITEKVLPELFKNIDKDGFVKVWLIACSTGEEVYSLAILLNEYIEEHNINANLRIFATDINKQAILTARKGIYSENSVKNIPEHLLKKYFKREGKNFVARQSIRTSLVFSVHDVTQDPPYSGLDLVVCRNMLIYMQPVLQKKVLTIIQFSLKLSGYMLLGNSESAQELSHAFQIISIKWKLYKNTDPSKRLILQKTNMLQSFNDSAKIKPIQSGLKNRTTFELICMALLQDSQAACVLIDANYNIVEALGAYKEYLSFSENKLVLNLLKMVSSDLSAIIVATISKAKKQNEAAIQKKIRVEHQDKLKSIRILVKPLLLNPLNREEGYLIVFNNDTSGTPSEWQPRTPHVVSDPELKVTELETELTEYKKTLQAIMEEVDISNEELKAINEELSASNEELQAANEELMSMNSEFQAKNKELADMNNDMEYFMENAQIGTLLLDKNLNIRRFNSSMQVHFNFMPQDTGRPITDFKNGEIIAKQSREVLKTFMPAYEELEEKGNWWFQRKIIPYFVEDNKVEGVVVTYVDLTAAKRKQKALKESEEQLQLAMKENVKIVNGLADAKRMLEKIVRVMPGIIYIFNLETMSNEYANKEVGIILDYSVKEIQELGEGFMAKMAHPEDLPQIMKYFEQTIKPMKDGEMSRLQYRIKHKDGTYRWLLSLDTVFERNKQNEVIKHLGFAFDITDIITAQERLELATKSMNHIFWDWKDMNTNDLWWSENMTELLGYQPDDIEPKVENFYQLIHPDDVKQALHILMDSFQNHTEFNMKARLRHKGGHYLWFENYGNIIKDEKQRISRMTGFGQLINEEKT